jgi:hypothetical protein
MSVSFKKTGNIIADGNPNNNMFMNTPRNYKPTSYDAYYLNLNENLVKGAKYTIQFWNVDVSHSGKAESTLGIWVYWGGPSVSVVSMIGTSYFTNGHADYIEKTFTAPTSTHSTTNNSWLVVYNSPSYLSGTMYMRIGKWKIEKMEVPTVYTYGDDVSVGNSGFVEYNDITKIQKNGFMQSIEFNEY